MVVKRYAVCVAAGVAWAVVVMDSIGLLPVDYTMEAGRVAFGGAILASVQLMLWSHQRPIGQAYDLGYEAGRRDQMRVANRPVTPIRRNAGGLVEFNRKALNGHAKQEVRR